MFGIGPQELVIIVFLMLVVFGPGKAVSMAKDLGRFVNEARNQVEELTGGLLDGEEDGDKPTSDPRSDRAGDGVPQRKEAKELSQGQEDLTRAAVHAQVKEEEL
jgi:Sec-independent protein translocase protein TatA